jgi:hypothetical protein
VPDPNLEFVTISPASHELLEAHAAAGEQLDDELARRLPNGKWHVPLSAEVLAELRAIDADLDVAIHTLCTTGVGRA